MAHNRELLDCSICLQLLEDPVTTACGHSYCVTCINTFWDRESNRGRTSSCPQCRETFSPRPVLRRNTLLAELLEEHRRGSAPVGPGGARCDACTGRKRKACRSCPVCSATHCQTHPRPDFEVAAPKKHSLIPASDRVRESVCVRHDKPLEIHCRTDRQFVCPMCVVDEHRGHDTVAVAAETREMQVIQREPMRKSLVARPFNCQ